MRVSGGRRHARRGIGTVLATIVFVFIVIFMTANLIVWGIVQSANLQSVFNQMTQRDQQQASEKVSIASALFGGTNKYVNCVIGTGSSCTNPTLVSQNGQSTTPLIANENFTSDTSSWVFTKILAPGTSSGISGGYDAGGTEIGAIGSPSGPGMVYMGVSFFPPSGTATYSATWSNRFFVDLSRFGIAGSDSFVTSPKCSGPNCAVVGSWAWILPRVNPGVISMEVKMEVADSAASGTSCTPPHCFVIDSQTYTTLADQTWNYRKSTWGGFSTSGTATGQSATTLQDTGQSWSTNQWANYTVTITSGLQTGESALVCTNTNNTLYISAPTSPTSTPCTSPTPWTTPAASSQYVIALTTSGTATGTQTSTTLQDTSQTWYSNEWKNYYVSIVAGTGTGQTLIITGNGANTLTLNAAWTTTPDSTSHYVIGCPSNTFCDWDVSSDDLIGEIPTTYSPAFWGSAAAGAFYTLQVETDFTVSQSANPSEVRVMFDDVGLEFKTPSSFAPSAFGGSGAGTIIDLPLTKGEDTGLIQQLTVSTATAFDAANIQTASYIRDYTTGIFVPLASGLVSQQTVNTTNTFKGADVQKYIGALTAQNLLNRPQSAAFDSSGNLWVADTGNNRVVEFLKGAGFTSGESATVVLGQSSFSGSSSATSASGLNSPEGIAFDSSGNLWVADTGNNRVVMFPTPFSNGERATVVLGQSSFSVSSPSPDSGTATGTESSTTLQDTSKSWASNQWANGIVSIVTGTGSGQSKTIVSNNGNTLTVSPAWSTTPVSGVSTYSISPSTTTVANLNAPVRLRLDTSGNVWVVDAGNNRVLRFPTPFSNGESANMVLGQSSYTTSGSATSATGLSGAVGLSFDSTGNLWVADTGNNRVVEFLKGAGFTVGETESNPIGQGSLLTNTPATTQSGLNAPADLAFDSSGNLWVADKANYRLLEFTSLSTPASASLVVGQSSYTVAAHPNVELEITATNPTPFHVKVMAASVQDFYKDPNHVTIQLTNGWASTSHIVDIFVTDSTGTHCFTRVPEACSPSYASGTASAVSSSSLTDSSQSSWTTNEWPGYFVMISSGTFAGSYASITSSTGNTDTPKDVLTLGGWTGTVPSGTPPYTIGLTWAGTYIAPGTTGVVTLNYTWANGPVTIKLTTDLGNTVVLNTIAS